MSEQIDDTRTRILDVAERLAQVRGYNGFSYADVAGELRMTKAALHYHFASKGDLGTALIERYAERFAGVLALMPSGGGDAPEQLAAYARIYLDVLRGNRMCLCGMLAAEYQTLPQPMQDAVRTFFSSNETWLIGVLEEGRRAGTLQFTGDALDVALMLVGGLEGALLIARTRADVRGFEASADRLLRGLAIPADARQPS